ncbi:unnamed protein product [Schistosoma guineensis]|uniref:High mobility group protein n=5 Tax=Schistosoma TaxID=6181 RepID=A0A183LCA0_9TREM|nr:High mobility group [Schistosoma haematobium]RTG87800.1 high mobility group protein B1 [Schistosoma bovis]CAH8536668.1 unnamed protein product [Schistosoma mattheei]CAH8545050.1 unnamed protein product [Schistosoma intercalatum]CAH8554404.1 unnamed protein product [Schistosoma guineensis]CAH8556378.1 unnamed protein product [Schistosoma margrebowiei]CAH8557621.1 unnamed protein product [Schistosoma curassoni]
MNKTKDKNKPKGPMSAYACFVQVIREEHKKKHPGEQIVFSDFSKKCAERWKLMTPKEKKRFEDLAVLDRERFNREMCDYVPPDGMKKGKKRKGPKDPTVPARAWSAFFFFCDEFRSKVRESNPDWKVADIAKELGRQWETCQDKAKYELLAQKDKQRYEEDMIKYRAGTYVPREKKLAGAVSNSASIRTSEAQNPDCATVTSAGGDENGAELEDEDDGEPDEGEEE